MDKWRPIAGAPYETPILVTWRNWRGNRVVGQAVLNMTTIESKSQVVETGTLQRVVSYWSTGMDGEDFLDIKPSHWMHMPTPPNDA